MHSLADVVSLAEGQSAAYRSARARRPHGVECIDIEREVDGGIGANVGEGHFDDAADAVSMRTGNMAQASVVSFSRFHTAR